MASNQYVKFSQASPKGVNKAPSSQLWWRLPLERGEREGDIKGNPNSRSRDFSNHKCYLKIKSFYITLGMGPKEHQTFLYMKIETKDSKLPD